MSNADTGSGLLQAILDAPDDDDRRLVYADWLEEHGEPLRAEFVRLQVELAAREHRLTHCPGCGVEVEEIECDECGTPRLRDTREGIERARVLREREQELLAANALDWFADLQLPGWHAIARFASKTDERHHGGWIDDDASAYIFADFHRGFVGEVACACQDWLDTAGPIMARCPVRRVRLTDKKPAETTDLFVWYPAWCGTRRGPHILPNELWEAMVSEIPWKPIIRDERCWYKTFHSRQTADDALSTACLLHGQQQAPIPTPVQYQ